MKKEYNSLSKYYDLLHNEKDYLKESVFFIKLIKKYKTTKNKKLLDVACGTGEHIKYFKKNFIVDGVDLSKNLIKIAKEKNSKIKFKVADMKRFKTTEKYGTITCLFSSLAYLKNITEIKQTLNNFYYNLEKGGVALIETFFVRDNLKELKNHVRKYISKNLKIKRTINININHNIANVEAKYEIFEKGKNKKVVKDKQNVKLYTKKELENMIEKIGFKVKILKYKDTETILFICIK
jgi:ubiquinone/menaquinone biosynthesis C-methylase UbiE